MRVIAVPRLRGPGRHRFGAQAFLQGIPRLPGSRRCLVLAVALVPLLGSCANNPIARQLAASFDPPAPTPAPAPGAGSPQATGGPAPQANSAAQGQAGANPADPNKVLRMAFPVAETGFDPVRVSDLYSNIVNSGIFQPLVNYNWMARPSTIVADAAEALPEVTEDGKLYTFKGGQRVPIRVLTSFCLFEDYFYA